MRSTSRNFAPLWTFFALMEVFTEDWAILRLALAVNARQKAAHHDLSDANNPGVALNGAESMHRHQ